MFTPALKKKMGAVCTCAVACITALSLAMPAVAERASLVIDADSGAVLHAKNARLQSFPASLTKLMTVYLILEAMASKRLSPQDQLRVSAAAARMPAVRLGLRQGQTITLHEVILAMIVRSANDAAVVAAEGMADGEPAFANLMNAKAKMLGMSDTVFYNASGLPHPGQITSARDMAILARALMADYPQYHSFFSTRTFHYHRKTFNVRHNFSNSADGIKGLKTGFTCYAGYNLVASVEKNGRRLIGVILGERSLRQRNARMSKILKQSFGPNRTAAKILTLHDLAIEDSQGPGMAPINKALADVCAVGPKKAGGFARASGWGLVIGVRKEQKEALALARQTLQQYRKTLKTGRPLAIPFLQGVLLNRACITDLKQENATTACRQLRNQNAYCIVINPKLVRTYVEKGHAALEKAQVAFKFSQMGKSSPTP